MMSLRKIPLESFIEILQQLFEEGADYIDIIGEENINNKDVIKITVRPEYFIHTDEKEVEESIEEQLETDYYKEERSSPLSEEDINDLM